MEFQIHLFNKYLKSRFSPSFWILFTILSDICYLLQSLLSPPTTNIQPLPEYKTVAAHKPRWIVSHYGALKVT